MMRKFAIFALVSAGLSATELRAAGAVGSRAPAIKPIEWINAPANTSWSSFRGRVILVERWATWCGPCREQIPHLNELLEKYEKKGLSIIGLTDEPPGTVKPFLKKNEMKYVIAAGVASDYQTQSIPYAWLVNPKGKIEWEGHPGNLDSSMIERLLSEVVLPPTFSLPKELRSAEKLLNAGKFGDAMKMLEGLAKKSKSPEVQAAAEEAITRANTYGALRLTQADEFAKEREYAEASQILKEVEIAFKGTDHAKRAKDLLREWSEDNTIKVELEGSAIIAKAEEMAGAKNLRGAAQLLAQVAKNKKYEGTKVQEIAAEKLAAIEKVLEKPAGKTP